jgi:hypothetical protein
MERRHRFLRKGRKWPLGESPGAFERFQNPRVQNPHVDTSIQLNRPTPANQVDRHAHRQIAAHGPIRKTPVHTSWRTIGGSHRTGVASAMAENFNWSGMRSAVRRRTRGALAPSPDNSGDRFVRDHHDCFTFFPRSSIGLPGPPRLQTIGRWGADACQVSAFADLRRCRPPPIANMTGFTTLNQFKEPKWLSAPSL